MKTPLKTVAVNSSLLDGRIPYKLLSNEKGDVFFRWLFIGQKKITEPFFDETISACLSLPENSEMPCTTDETLLERAVMADAVSPSAFIFHISRCGSTLLSQLLCIDERFIVLSEVPLLDQVLRLPFSGRKDAAYAEKLFPAVLSLLGQKRNGNEEYLFVKTDSWHLMFFETIRKLFPAVPALLLYRSPAEVIRSHQKLWGMHAVPGPLEREIFGFGKEVDELFPDVYLERVLGKYFKKIIDILASDNYSKAVSFHDGAMEMLHGTLQSCAITLQTDVLDEMEKRTTHHSKFPENKFVPEMLIQNASSSIVTKLFEQLEDAKEKQSNNA
ncbi:MAG: sulfotransferase family protein [Bacteroidia bacterium]